MSAFFKDPILLVGGLFLSTTIVILAWALNKFQSAGTAVEEITPETEEPYVSVPPAETSGLTEARLQEISSQFAAIAQRLDEIDKNLRSKRSNDQTIPSLLGPAEMEKFIKRIESRLEVISADKPAASAPQGDSISRLEAKLEGIHRLLILLTDSGNPDQK